MAKVATQTFQPKEGKKSEESSSPGGKTFVNKLNWGRRRQNRVGEDVRKGLERKIKVDVANLQLKTAFEGRGGGGTPHHPDSLSSLRVGGGHPLPNSIPTLAMRACGEHSRVDTCTYLGNNIIAPGHCCEWLSLRPSQLSLSRGSAN